MQKKKKKKFFIKKEETFYWLYIYQSNSEGRVVGLELIGNLAQTFHEAEHTIASDAYILVRISSTVIVASEWKHKEFKAMIIASQG